MRNVKNVAMKSVLLGVLALTIITGGCTGTVNSNVSGNPKDFDYGRIANGKYINSFFNFEIILPPGWVVQTREQNQVKIEQATAWASGEDKNMGTSFKVSLANTTILLNVYQYEVGAPVDFNPSFALTAENVQYAPGIKTGSDFLFHGRRTLKKLPLQLECTDGEFQREDIHGQAFYVMNVSMKDAGVTLKQKYYATVRNRFALGVIMTFINDEQKNTLEKVIHSITFNK